MSSPSLSLIYRNAIALNNLGVTMLQKCMLTEAIETFKDSFAFIKYTIHNKDYVPDDQQDTAMAESSTIKYQEATQRMSKSKTDLAAVQKFAHCLNVQLARLSDLSVIPASDSVEGVHRLINPICIDQVDVNESSLCSVVLTNLSLSYQCSAMLESECGNSDTNSTTPNKCLTKALDLMRIAFSVQRRVIENCQLGDGNIAQSYIHNHDQYQLMQLIIRECVIVMKRANNIDEAQVFQTEFDILTNFINAVDTAANVFAPSICSYRTASAA